MRLNDQPPGDVGVGAQAVMQHRRDLAGAQHAVKQNGSGEDVVRVIDLAKGGNVKEVAVETGLTEGSYIQVKKGLRGDETVIVEVQQPQ